MKKIEKRIDSLLDSEKKHTILNMASALDRGAFEFNTKELEDLSEIIFELGFMNVELNKIHTIHEGIKFNEQIVLSSSRGLMGKKITGCTPNLITGVEFSEKVWTPALEDFRLEHCSAQVNQQDKLINQMSKMNPDFYNIFEGSQSKLGAFLVASILVRFHEEILRKVWFNELTAATQANGGELTNGTDIGYFNTFDGIFKQFRANLMATNRVVIAENAQTTYATQALVAGRGKAILNALWSKADMRLRANPDAHILVTQTIWDAYLADLEAIENAGAGNITTTEDGKTVLKYRGIELIPMHIWDRVIGEYYNTGTAWIMPHRAVLTTADNVPIGTLSKSDFDSLEAFYDKYNKVNVIDGAYSIDSKILEDYLIVMAL